MVVAIITITTVIFLVPPIGLSPVLLAMKKAEVLCGIPEATEKPPQSQPSLSFF